MTLTNNLRYTIATAVQPTLLGEPTFWAKPRLEQLAILQGLVPDVAAADLGAFLTLILLRRKVIAVGSVQHLEAVGEVKQAWHKDNPPINIREFTAAGYEPSWTPEFDAVPWVAAQLCYNDVFADPLFTPATPIPAPGAIPARLRKLAMRNSMSPHMAAALFREKFGLGGLNDIYHPGALDIEDPTMKVLVEAALDDLTILRPEWFGDTPVSDAGKRSKAAIDQEVKEAYEKKKAEERAAAKAIKVEAERKAHREAVAAAAVTLETMGLFRDVMVGVICEANFEALQAAMESLPASLQVYANAVTPPIAADAKDVSAAAAEATETGLNYVVQAILRKLAMDPAKEGWFTELANGDLKVRSQPLKTKPATLSRAQSVLRNHITDLTGRYGNGELSAALSALFGVPVDLPPLVVAPPAPPAPPAAPAAP